MRNIYRFLLDRLPTAGPLVLTTIVSTEGSTPQKPGSSALFGPSGLLAGTIGGGVLEGKVGDLAREAMEKGESGLHRFEFGNDISEKEEAICGGRAMVLVDTSAVDHAGVYREMERSSDEGIPGVLITRVTRDARKDFSIRRYWVTGAHFGSLPKEYAVDLEPHILEMMTGQNPPAYKEVGIHQETDAVFYLEAVFPMPRLIIAGAGHIGKALSHLGRLLDFCVTVIDDRPEYANPVLLPDADKIVVDDPGRALAAITDPASAYIVIVTRGHKDDAAALKACIHSGAKYIGMIGSSRKIALVRREFLDKGWASAELWESVHAPIGLPIPSKSVQEIAVSIAAQLIDVRNRPASA
jgi:xanthine dehydrogenase accessory factor